MKPICNFCHKRKECQIRYLELLFCSSECVKEFKNKIPNIKEGLSISSSKIIEIFSKTDTMRRMGLHAKLICDCGKEFIRRADFIKKRVAQNKVISCGCKTVYNKPGKLSSSWIGVGDLSGAYFAQLRCKSKTKNIEFTIAIEYLWNLFLEQDKKCALTNLELKFATSRRIDPIQTASLDRIDSKRGYIEGNVQWLHKDINYMKRTYSQEHFIKMCNLVTQKTLLL